MQKKRSHLAKLKKHTKIFKLPLFIFIMFIKIIKSYRDVVAICDSELLGKKFEEGELQLDIKENFFKGEEVDENKAMEIIKDMEKEDATFNIIGKKSVDTALKAKIISKEGVKKIRGVPFALVLL